MGTAPMVTVRRFLSASGSKFINRQRLCDFVEAVAAARPSHIIPHTLIKLNEQSFTNINAYIIFIIHA